MDLKIGSVFLLNFSVCFFLLSFGYSDEIGEGGHQPVVGLYILSFGHQKKKADINCLVPVLKFLGKKLILAQPRSAHACANQQYPWAGLDLMNLVISNMVSL